MPSLIERREEIVRQAESEGRVLVESLADQFGVSEVTIRHDLNALGRRGLLVRTRGGAVPSTRLTRELTVEEKYHENFAVKRLLGKAAVDLLEDDARNIIIDSGTTTEEVARGLLHRSGITVMTNGLNIARVLADAEELEVKVTGGTLRPKSLSFYGRQAEESLRYMRFDYLFLGVDGFDQTVGVSTHFEPEASLNRLMCQIAGKVIVVTDSSKFGKLGSHLICGHEEIDVIVTDSNAPAEVLDILRSAGVEVHLVGIKNESL